MPTASVNGAEIYYEVHGEGAPLILSHTGMSDVSSWANNIDTLSQHCKVVTYDRRDCGRSTSPEGTSSAETWVADLKGLMDHLGIEKAVIGGVSYGSLITLEFLLAHPDMAEGGIIVSGTTQGFAGGGSYSVAFPDRSADLGSIGVPVLVVHGADDRSFPPAMAEFTRDHITNAEAAILYGAGHSLHAENAVTFNTIVVGWLTKRR